MQAERRQIVLSRGLYWALGAAALGALIYGLREVLTPIFLAFTIAYILDPVVDRLERWRLPRALAIGIVLLGFTALAAGFFLLVIPEIVRDVAAVLRELPDHAKRALARAEPWLAAQGVVVPHTADEWIAKLRTHADSLSADMLAPVGDIAKTIIGGTASAIGAIFGALIVPILAVYLLMDFDPMIAGIRNLVPARFRPSVVWYAREIDQVLSQFLRGQLTVMAILAVLYGGAYALLGVRLAIPIGIAAGILNFVPPVGGAFALVAGLVMSLIGGGGWGQIGGVVAAYAVVQTLEGFVITPRIVGESVGLREIWVLLALFVGGEVFGFLGVLLAVPVAAVLKIFVARAIERYRESQLFLEPGEALAEGAPSEAPVDPCTEPSVPEAPLEVETNDAPPAPDAVADEAPSQPDADAETDEPKS